MSGIVSRVATLVLACGLLTLLGAAPAFAQKRVALVIGNSAYVNVSSLPNAKSDANAVAAMFKSAHYDVVQLKQDVGIVDLRRAVRDFADVAYDADIAVVYYAGHGIEVDGTNYLIPIDAKLSRDFDVEDETVSLDRVVKAMESARRLRLVVLDACRDNPFTRTMKRSVASRSIGRGLAKVEPTVPDTLIAFAAKAGSVALDGEGQNSPFTTALVRHVATPGLDIRLAFGRVRDDVLEATKRQQEPFVYGSLGGSTVALVEQPAAAATRNAASPAPASIEASLRDALKVALPDLSEATLDQRMKDYVSKNGHRALAVRPGRGTWQRWNQATSALAEETTLEGCQVYYGQPCALIGLDDTVVKPDRDGNWQLRDMARTRYTGTFDLDRVPVGWSFIAKDGKVASYRNATTPKAAVMHPWGNVFVVTNVADQHTAEVRAFEACESDPRRNGKDGPCYLYAVGDQVVLTKRQSKPTP